MPNGLGIANLLGRRSLAEAESLGMCSLAGASETGKRLHEMGFLRRSLRTHLVLIYERGPAVIESGQPRLGHHSYSYTRYRIQYKESA